MEEQDLPPYTQLGELLPAWAALSRKPPKYEREKRPTALTTEARAWATDALLRAAAYETGAIEDLYTAAPGATREIAEETPGWEQHLADAGDDVPDTFQDQLNGYIWAREYAADKEALPLTAAAMREVHKIVCRTQSTYDTTKGPRTLDHGEYKTSPNYVTDRWGRPRAYCPVPMLDAEITTAFDFFRALEDGGADSPITAAFLHWAIAHIHPFQDGNGRTARVLASVPLLRTDNIPMLVFSDRKQIYLQALDAADYGKPADLVDYTIARARDTSAWWRTLGNLHMTQPLDAAFAELADLIAAQTQPAEAAITVLNRVKEATRQALVERLDPLTEQGFTISPPDVTSSSAASVTVRAKAPYTVAAMQQISTSLTDADSKLIITTSVTERLTFGIAEISPTLSTEATIRIGLLADQIVAALTQDLRQQIEKQARARGQLPQR